MIPHETIERIRDIARIEEVVGDYISLHKKGANWWGLCPFHNEKTSSFSVSPSRGIFKCFGCGEAGNAITFVQKMENCSYPDAVRTLARKYHVEIQEKEETQEDKQKNADRESMNILNEWAQKWFEQQLWDTQEGQSVGIPYFMQERGLREDIIRTFGLGYGSNEGKNPLMEAAHAKGFKDEYLLNSSDTRIGTGLCGKSEDGRTYDRFKGRVIFPFYSVSGKITGFAGRILVKKENVGKYINSPDSLTFSKHNEMFGLFQAKKEIQKQGIIYLVEGQMDVLSWHQAGITNTICSGGTALTQDHVRLMHRFANNVLVVYDSDAAGIHATQRAIGMLLEEGMNVKILVLPDGEDPDSFARSQEASQIRQYIEQKQVDWLRYLVPALMREVGEDTYKYGEVITGVAETLSLIHDNIKRQLFISDAARLLHFDAEELKKKVNLTIRKHIEEREKRKGYETSSDMPTSAPTSPAAASSPSPIAAPPTAPMQPATEAKSAFNENERNIVEVMVRYGEQSLQYDEQQTTIGEYIITELRGSEIELQEPTYRRIFEIYEENMHTLNFVPSKFFSFYQDAEINRVAIGLIEDPMPVSRIFLEQLVSENVSEPLQEKVDPVALAVRVVYELKFTIVGKRIDDLQRQIADAQADGDSDRIMEILASMRALTDAKRSIGALLGGRMM